MRYFARQWCHACEAATDWYKREGGAIFCGACVAREDQRAAWAVGWLALTDRQREHLEFLRWRIQRGQVTEGVVV